MSTAGMFQILTNDGKQDKLLMASDFLRERLYAIRQARIRMGYKDINPTLMDIEKTHLLFLNAHFKPFCAMGFEYTRTNVNSGNPSFSNEIIFSIPQYGDFFHDMFFYVKLNQPVMKVNDGVADSDAPLMRWTSYPGERFFSSVKFEVNGNPLDEYTSQSFVFYRQMRIMPHKEQGYARCMGQEEPEVGYLQQPVWNNNGVANSDVSHRFQSVSFSGLQTPTGQKSNPVELLIPLLFWFNLDARLSVPSVTIPFGQRWIKSKICAGNELVDLVPRGSGTWDNPLGSLDYSNMIVNIYLYINNIFVNKEIHDIFIERIGFSLIRVHRYQSFTLNLESSSLLLSQLKWPTETILVGFRPSDYSNASSDGLRRQHLNKWNIFHKVSTIERKELGWHSDRLEMIANPFGSNAFPAGVFNNTASATTPLQFNVQVVSGTNTVAAGTLKEIAKGDVIEFEFADGYTARLHAANVIRGDGTTAAVIIFKQLVGEVTGTGKLSSSVAKVIGATDFANATYGTETASDTWRVWRPMPAQQVHVVDQASPLISNIKLESHGIVLIDNFPEKILNAYVPFHYGGANLRSPDDIGIYMINFCLYPGSYQPSGHINTSRAREFYLQYSGAPFSPSYTGEVLIEASCLNFLLISDGSAVLRYTT